MMRRWRTTVSALGTVLWAAYFLVAGTSSENALSVQSVPCASSPTAEISADSIKAAPSIAPANTRSDCVNVNTATIDQLTVLPGIGPVIAGEIIATRQQAGTFAKPEDLTKVKGIGPARLTKIRNLICF